MRYLYIRDSLVLALGPRLIPTLASAMNLGPRTVAKFHRMGISSTLSSRSTPEPRSGGPPHGHPTPDANAIASLSTGGGLSSAERHRPRRVLRRQCPAGGLLLPGRLRHVAGRLCRPRDRSARPRQLRPAAGQGPLRAHHGAPLRLRHRRATSTCTATASATSPSGSTTPASPGSKPPSAVRAASRSPPNSADDRWPRHHRQHRHLRRHHPHLRRAHQLQRPLLPRLRGRQRKTRSRAPPACCTSTTSSATSAGTR